MTLRLLLPLANPVRGKSLETCKALLRSIKFYMPLGSYLDSYKNVYWKDCVIWRFVICFTLVTPLFYIRYLTLLLTDLLLYLTLVVIRNPCHECSQSHNAISKHFCFVLFCSSYQKASQPTSVLCFRNTKTRMCFTL